MNVGSLWNFHFSVKILTTFSVIVKKITVITSIRSTISTRKNEGFFQNLRPLLFQTITKENFSLLFFAFEKQKQYWLALHKIWSIPLRISSVNVIKSAVSNLNEGTIINKHYKVSGVWNISKWLMGNMDNG